MDQEDNKLYFHKSGTGSGKSSLLVNSLLSICNGKCMFIT